MLVTNISNKEKDKYLKYIKEYREKTGNKDIYLDNNAYSNGVKLEDCCAIRSNTGDVENLNIFYRIKDKHFYLKEAEKEIPKEPGAYHDYHGYINDSVCREIEKHGFKCTHYDFGIEITRIERV